MKTLVIGASGAFGTAICTALSERGHEVTAFSRRMTRPAHLPELRIRQGDVLDSSAVDAAVRGQDAIVFAMNAPYHQWAKIMPAATENVAAAASRHGTTILFPGNVYHLPTATEPLDENTPPAPPTAKGALRLELENRLHRAADEGAKTIILRMGDYFGSPVSRQWFHEIAKSALKGGALSLPAPDGVPHQWAYLPDAAQAGVLLLERRQELENHACFHFSGDGQADNHRLVAAIGAALKRKEIGTKPYPWTMLKVIGLFSPLVREVVAMRYLWDEALLLNDAKLRQFLGEGFRPTAFEDAIAATLAAMAPAEKKKGCRKTAA